MNKSPLYEIKKEDVSKAVAVLKNAFEEDPLWNAVFQDDPNREQALTSFFTIPILFGQKFGHVYAPSSNIEGVIVCVDGKRSYMTMLRLIRCNALSYGSKIGRTTMKNMAIVSKQIEPDRKKYMKGKQYIYITVIGVDAAFQGKGYGTLLLERIKQECDRINKYMYLETETQDNVRFYEKHGFVVLKKVTFDALGVPMWQMQRPPVKA